ncbi:hypothetical protein ACFS2C_21920 [Prauserella oleivorans]|uniref:LPXTG-motif cell wall-anchored protein n=1 Tax=Prauserella oleivorans TaxID=1478153 RepID=A0ABW5WET9_9PSEU
MPSMPRARLRTFLVAAVTGGLLAGPVAVAAATGAGEDPRAEIHVGNVTTCADAGLDGVQLKGDTDFDYALSDQQKHLAITSVTEGVTVTGIVVKGGPDANIYVPGERGLPEQPVWKKLRSPLNGGGQIPTISHWFVCGEVTPPTTTEPTTTTTEPSEPTISTPPQPTTTTTVPAASTTGESSTTPVTTTSSEAGGAVATTTTEAPVSPAGESDDLASTGFGGGWLLVAGVALLAGGGALVLLARARRGQA